MADDLLTTAEAARLLGVSQATIRAAIRSGALPAQRRYTLGAYTYLLRRADVVAYGAERRAGLVARLRRAGYTDAQIREALGEADLGA